MIAAETILAKHNGPLLEITINRPDEGNTMTDEMAVELTRLLHGAEESGAELVVLRGAGTDFCRGRAGMGGRNSVAVEALDRRRSSEVVFNAYGAFRQTQVPIIGVINGRAAGFGCALAALCDVTLAAHDATFQVPEMQHNIFPTMVMSALIDRVPRKALQYLVYTTAPVSAERALAWGIVSEIAPAGKLDETLASITAPMLKAPRIARLSVKEYLRTAFDLPLAGAVDFARNIHATINSSSEIRPK
jgi:enoyl-CoA hydratase